MSGLRFGLSLSMQGRGGKAWRDYDLFETGSGFLYDFSRADTLFQEATGTTPAGVDQNVGLALDISKSDGRGIVNRLIQTEDLSVNAWSKLNYSATSDTVTTTGGGGNIFQTVSVVAGTSYTFSFYARRGTATEAKYSIFDVTNAADIVAATTYYSAINGVSDTRVEVAFTAPPGCTSARVYVMRDNGSSGTTFVRRMQFEMGASASVYQKNTTTVGGSGNHASQATSGARPVLKAGGLTRYDGSDDNLLTTLVPSAAMTLAFKGKITSASKGIISSRTASTDAVELAINASGNLIANVGSGVLTGASDIRGITGIGILVFDASTTELYWNGSQVDSDARAGSVNTTVPFRVGCRNTSGTGSLFADADIYQALAINRALTPAEVLKLNNYWMSH